MTESPNCQSDSDDESCDEWSDSGPHRRRVMREILSPECSPNGSVCVLGAGETNDIDLNELLERFRRVSLVDLDRTAIEKGVNRKQIVAADRLQICSPLDVTGIANLLDKADEPDVDQLLKRIVEYRIEGVGEPFDIVVSTCLLSQLILALVQQLTVEHPRFIELARAIRLQHLEMIARLLKPGGTGLLIVDIVSSDTIRDLGTTPADELSTKLTAAIRDQNFFHGMNPVILAQTLTQAPLDRQVSHVKLLQPWLWNNSYRIYAVTGLRFTKQPDS